MRANVLTDWGKLEPREMPTPAPRKGQALVEVVYAGICGSDVTVHDHRHPTATAPRVMCHEILGIVREINCGDPLPYRTGSRVAVFPLSSCGACGPCRDGYFHVCANLRILGLHMDGGFAEYVCADVEKLFPVAPEVPDRVAALAEPLAVGFHANARAGTRPGDKALIIGAGPIGILCAVCSGYFRASRVVVSEINPGRAALARSLGLEVVDAGNGDVLARLMEASGGAGFDRVFEASGSRAGAMLVAAAAKIRGAIVPIGIPHGPLAYETGKIILKELSLIGSRVHTLTRFGRAVETLGRLHAAKTHDLDRLIAAVHPLEKLADGIAQQRSGELNGKILIDVRAHGS